MTYYTYNSLFRSLPLTHSPLIYDVLEFGNSSINNLSSDLVLLFACHILRHHDSHITPSYISSHFSCAYTEIILIQALNGQIPLIHGIKIFRSIVQYR